MELRAVWLLISAELEVARLQATRLLRAQAHSAATRVFTQELHATFLKQAESNSSNQRTY